MFDFNPVSAGEHWASSVISHSLLCACAHLLVRACACMCVRLHVCRIHWSIYVKELFFQAASQVWSCGKVAALEQLLTEIICIMNSPHCFLARAWWRLCSEIDSSPALCVFVGVIVLQGCKSSATFRQTDICIVARKKMQGLSRFGCDAWSMQKHNFFFCFNNLLKKMCIGLFRWNLKKWTIMVYKIVWVH